MAHPRFLFLAFALAVSSVNAVPTPQALQVSRNDLARSRYALSAHMTDGSRNCGPGNQMTTGWTIQTEQWWARETTNTPNGQALVNTLGGYYITGSGQFQTPINGVYYLSGFARCETGACDTTIRLNAGTRLCAFGTDIIQRRGDNSNFGGNWQTSGCATLEYLTQGSALTMWLESGASTDCTLETSFSYHHFNALLLMADQQVATFIAG